MELHRRDAHDPDPGDERVAEEAELDALIADVRTAERSVARAVLRAGHLAGSGVAERVAGQPLELLLGVACRMVGADRATLVTAGEVLGDMPVLRDLFVDGTVSWGQVRAIVRLVRKRSQADRAWLDARIAATQAEHGDVTKLEPDELVEACERTVDELRDVRDVEADEAGAIADSFVAIQRDFGGGAALHGRLDPLSAATVVGALDRAAPTPRREPADRGPAATDAGWTTTSRSHAYASALDRICAEWAGGHAGDVDGDRADVDRGIDDASTDGTSADGGRDTEGGSAGTEGGSAATPATRRRLRPLVHLIVDAKHATTSTAGVLDLPIRGVLPRLTAAGVEALMCDATVQAVLTDGQAPLAATDKVTAATVPDKTRLAVEARDKGCRWPGCDAPLAHGDIHHVCHRADSGTHDPANLVVLCRRDHVLAHGHDWTLELTAATGELVGIRGGRRRWATMPRGTPLTALGDHHRPGRDPPAAERCERAPRGPDLPGPDEPPSGAWGSMTDEDGDPLPF